VETDVRIERIPGIRQVPALLARRRRDLVLFDSWRGTYSDNPQAISDELHVRRPDLAQVWVADAGAAIPPWADSVRPGTRAYFSALGRASHVVTNIGMPGYYRKRNGTSYLQTWHGTPLKRIALDIRTTPGFADDPRFFDRLDKDVAKWDALVSPNAFSTEIFRRAFDYDGRILETGYPRNDLLSAPAAPERRRAARESLGVGESTMAVLYAPTWRDSRSFDLQLDVAALMERLGDGHALLLRPHPHAPVPRDDLHRGAIDVSSHPDIRELYLAADVLVTDYSSAMFDFAVTRKPMLFFTYDLAEYRDVTRGFYFDFEDEAPGPLLATTDELGDALQNLEAITARHASAYGSFHERFCSLEDGRAAARVVDAFFGPAA
jgi:CDP-glycerol glycerophosphotransferase